MYIPNLLSGRTTLLHVPGRPDALSQLRVVRAEDLLRD